MEKIHTLNTDAYKLMIEALPIALFFADAEGGICVWNKAIEEKLGLSVADITGNTLAQAGLTSEICGQKPESSAGCGLDEYLQGLDIRSSYPEEQNFCLHIRSEFKSTDFTCHTVYADSGSLLGVVGIANELEEISHLQHCAYIGSSTVGSTLDADAFNVLTTAAFYDALSRDWHRYQRYQNTFSLLSLEIDYYSHFEAVLGESAASDLITQLIANIGSSLRRSDIIGQVGANRFIILLSNSDRKSALKVANMLLNNLNQQTCPDLPFLMSASVGAVSVEDKQSLDKTLERADNALRRSVEMGRNQVTFWG